MGQHLVMDPHLAECQGPRARSPVDRATRIDDLRSQRDGMVRMSIDAALAVDLEIPGLAIDIEPGRVGVIPIEGVDEVMPLALRGCTGSEGIVHPADIRAAAAPVRHGPKVAVVAEVETHLGSIGTAATPPGDHGLLGVDELVVGPDLDRAGRIDTDKPRRSVLLGLVDSLQTVGIQHDSG